MTTEVGGTREWRSPGVFIEWATARIDEMDDDAPLSDYNAGRADGLNLALDAFRRWLHTGNPEHRDDA